MSAECRMMHITEICSNPLCEIKSCNLRHPKVCKYFRDYKRCKFGEWCYFAHSNNNNIDDLENAMNEKCEDLKAQVEQIELKIEALEIKEMEIILILKLLLSQKLNPLKALLKH